MGLDLNVDFSDNSGILQSMTLKWRFPAHIGDFKIIKNGCLGHGCLGHGCLGHRFLNFIIDRFFFLSSAFWESARYNIIFPVIGGNWVAYFQRGAGAKALSALEVATSREYRVGCLR